jgi:phosphoglycolate phosphatase
VSGASPVFRHVVFDLDGTLVDTKDDLAEAVNVTLETLGLPRRDPRTLWSYVGQGARRLLEQALAPDHGSLIEPALDVFMPWYRAHLLDRAAVYPGIEAALEALGAAGVRLSVLTNKPADMSLAIVRGLGLARAFPRVIGGDSLPVRKPDPGGLLRLVAATGVPAAATLMVGDSAIDVATGRNAGVSTCGVLWGFNGAAVRESGADVVVAAPAELVPVSRAGIPPGARR